MDGVRGARPVLDAMKPAPELREASRQMGRQTLRVGAALTAIRASPRIETRWSGRAPGHHAVVFGVTGGVLGWEREAAAAA